MWLYKIALILLSVLPAVGKPYDGFVKKYERQYRREAWKRPSDTLYYVPEVMNLIGRRDDFITMPPEQTRPKFFDMLSRGKVRLCYPFALDVKSGEVYHNVYGDIDRRILLHKRALETYHPRYKQEMTALLTYIRETRPDYLFTMAEITGLECTVYWAIRDSMLFAVEYNQQDGTIKEYDAEEYVRWIGEDTTLSPWLRFQVYLEEQ